MLSLVEHEESFTTSGPGGLRWKSRVGKTHGVSIK